MKKSEYSTYRDVVGYHLETAAKQPFIQKVKGEMTLTVGPDVWNSLENLEKAAHSMHPDFKNLWKWVKKTHPQPDNFNFVRLDLINLLFLLKYDLKDELKRWADGMRQNNGFSYLLPL